MESETQPAVSSDDDDDKLAVNQTLNFSWTQLDHIRLEYAKNNVSLMQSIAKV